MQREGIAMGFWKRVFGSRKTTDPSRVIEELDDIVRNSSAASERYNAAAQLPLGHAGVSRLFTMLDKLRDEDRWTILQEFKAKPTGQVERSDYAPQDHQSTARMLYAEEQFERSPHSIELDVSENVVKASWVDGDRESSHIWVKRCSVTEFIVHRYWKAP